MAGMADMARMMAAGGGDAGGMGAEAGSPDMESQDPNAPEDGPEMGGSDADEALTQGIQMIEAGITSLPGDLGEKARQLLEGLKEIAVQAEAAEGPEQQAQEGEEPDGSDANSGSIESPSSPQVGGSAESYGT